jgi:HSP20 family molecular chaperone IbpA
MSTATGLAPSKALRNLWVRDPFSALKRMNALFGEDFGLHAFPSEENLAATAWTPSCDVFETNGEIVIKVELPEVKKEEVHIIAENNC